MTDLLAILTSLSQVLGFPAALALALATFVIRGLHQGKDGGRKVKAVYGYTFFTGASTLLNVKEQKGAKRRYTLTAPVRFSVDFDDGTLEVVTHPGFIFDGRSGPRIADIYAPNLGSLDERAAWLMHDALGYAGSLGFKETNIALKLFLRDICGYRRTKAEAIRIAVSLSKSWYGRPKPTDWCYANIGLVETSWRKIG